MKKLISSFLLITILLTSFLTTAYAESNKSVEIKATDGRIVNFTIKAGLKPDLAILENIANNNPDTTAFTILDIGLAELTSANSQINKNDNLAATDGKMGIAAIPVPIPFTLTKNQTQSNVFESDRWMESCAKGQTKYVTTAIEAQLSPTYTGLVVGLSLNGSIKYTITSGTTLTGPPEGAYANCREYRCQFYQNTGWWSQQWLINGIVQTLYGSYAEPAYYYSYSRDLRI